MANDFKPQMDGNAGPQPKKRRKANANAANANAANNTASKKFDFNLNDIVKCDGKKPHSVMLTNIFDRHAANNKYKSK